MPAIAQEQIFLSLGSNHQCEQHLRQSLVELRKHFTPLMCSKIYRSPPIDGEGDDYWNMVVAFTSEKTVGTLVAICKNIEESLGRTRVDKRVTIDIDVLLVGNHQGEFATASQAHPNKTLLLPHSDIERYSHVLEPLAELAPETMHPGLLVSFKALLESKQFEPLIPIEQAY